MKLDPSKPHAVIHGTGPAKYYQNRCYFDVHGHRVEGMKRSPAVAARERAVGKDIAGALVAARTEAGLTQADVAERMGTTQSAIARLESGGVNSISTLRRYAEALGYCVNITLERQDA